MVTAPLQLALSGVSLTGYLAELGGIAAETMLQFAVGFTFFVAFGVLFVGSIVVQAVLVWWTYTDAKKHNVDSPELWAGVVFLAPLLGLLIYLLVGRDGQSF